MADMMNFPASVEEFMEQYKMTDTEHVYSNGTEFVPIYRMMQWFNHVNPHEFQPMRHGRWLPYQTPIETRQSGWICNQCSGVAHDVSNGDTDYCPNCGAKMDGGAE